MGQSHSDHPNFKRESLGSTYQSQINRTVHVQVPTSFHLGVSGLGDSSVNLAVRPYAKPKNYWEVYFDIYEQGKKALDAAAIEIPFPQRVVHTAKT